MNTVEQLKYIWYHWDQRQGAAADKQSHQMGAGNK